MTGSPKPLDGKHVAVTRPRELAASWQLAFEEQGARVTVFPLFELVAAGEAHRRQWLRGVTAESASSDDQWVAFTSATAASRALAMLAEPHQVDRFRRSYRVAVVGASTGAEVRKFGLEPDLQLDRGGAEALANRIVDLSGAGLRVLHPSRPDPVGTLSGPILAAGGSFEPFVVYESSALGDVDPSVLLTAGLDLITFASPSAVRLLWEASTEADRTLLLRLDAVAVGDATAAALRELGFGRLAVSSAPHADAVVAETIRLTGRPSH